MITPKFLTTAEEMAERIANHERDQVPAGSPLVSHAITEVGKTPHKHISVRFNYANGSAMSYGPVGGNAYGWKKASLI